MSEHPHDKHRQFPICKDHTASDWNQPTLEEDACVLCRLFYLEAQEGLLEEWQQRAKLAEDTIAEILRSIPSHDSQGNVTRIDGVQCDTPITEENAFLAQPMDGSFGGRVTNVVCVTVSRDLERRLAEARAQIRLQQAASHGGESRDAVIEECRQAIKGMYQTSDQARDLIEVTRILDALRALKGQTKSARPETHK